MHLGQDANSAAALAADALQAGAGADTRHADALVRARPAERTRAAVCTHSVWAWAAC
jgi:hypothetical protein